MGEKLICSEPPGICSQEEFDHDWLLVMKKLDDETRFDLLGLLVLSASKKYKIKDLDEWPDSLE